MIKNDQESGDSAKHTSYWIETTPKTNYPNVLPKEMYDVAIVGGGIAGVTLAYMLSNSGKKVIIIEAGKILEGVTGNTSAKITSLHDLIYDYLIHNFGKVKAKQYADAQQSAVEWIAATVKEKNIDCDFTRTSSYTYTEDSEKIEEIRKEVESAKSLGLPASFVTETELPYRVEGAVCFENQAYFHPRKFLLALADQFIKSGSIVERVRVKDIKEGEPCEVITENGNLKAKDVVIATHYPILDRGLFFTRLTPLRSYVLGVYINGKIPRGMYINIEDPLFSLRPQPTGKGEMLVITGFTHKTGHHDNKINYFQGLKRITENKFEIKSINSYWATQDNDTIDRAPYIGKYMPNSKHLYVATGFGGWGMTNGVVSAMILNDLINSKNNPWAEVFDPSRTYQLKGAKQFAKQNAEVGKMFIEEKFLKHYSDKIKEIKNDEAKVLEIEGEKIAVYKNNSGKLYSVSAVCQHLGCIINFNNTEKSWDCPCHGSRYDIEGKVLHGPTVKDLPKFEKED